MKKTLKTSVVIPAYNESDYLEMCLAALTKQSTAVHEIIVVDNNSSDGSIGRAKRRFKSVRFLHEPKQGIVYARNTGFDAATGDIIAKLDADTIVDEDWHAQLLKAFEDGAEAWSGYVSSNEVHPLIAPIMISYGNFIVFRGIHAISGNPFIVGCNLAMRKKLWKRIKPYLMMRNDIWEDLDMSTVIARYTRKVAIDRTPHAVISSRSANVPLIKMYRRMYGHSRVYLLRKKYLAYVLSFVVNNFSFMIYLLLWPLAKIGQSLKTRPRLEQY